MEKIAFETEQLRGLRFVHKVEVVPVEATVFDGSDASNVGVWSPGASDEAVYSCVRGFAAVGTHAPCTYESRVGGTEIDIAASVARALKLAPPNATLPNLPLSIEKAGAVARYDPQTKRIEVRGPLEKIPNSVLVHELTHALQDQHFSLRYTASYALDESLAYRALVEGDAVRIEDAYRKRHEGDAEQAKLEDSLTYEATDRVIDAISTETSESIEAELRLGVTQFPYVSGADYAKALETSGGQAAIDAKFREPATSSAEIMRGGVERKPIPFEPGIGFDDLSYEDQRFNDRSTSLGALYWSIAFAHHGLFDETKTFVDALAEEDAVVFYVPTTREVCFADSLQFVGPSAQQAEAGFRALAKKIGADVDNRPHGLKIQACDPSTH